MTPESQQAALKPYRERILALLDKEVAFAEKHLGSYDTEWMKGIRALVMSEPEVSSTPAPVDHAALAEKLADYKQADDDGVMCLVSRQAVDEAVAALRAHPAGGVDTRSCTCHPDEAPVPCQRKFALSECLRAAGIGAGVVPEDVVRLVLAARAVAFDIVPDLVRSSPASPQIKNGALVLIKSLDRASEAFAERVPWDDEPEGT